MRAAPQLLVTAHDVLDETDEESLEGIDTTPGALTEDDDPAADPRSGSSAATRSDCRCSTA